MKDARFYLKSAIGGAIFGLIALGMATAFAWTTPPASPPNSNASAPINVSSAAQTKTGNLSVTGNFTAGQFCLNGSCYSSWPFTTGTGLAGTRIQTTAVCAEHAVSNCDCGTLYGTTYALAALELSNLGSNYSDNATIICVK